MTMSCALFEPYKNVDEVILSRMEAFSIPGVSAVVLNSEGILWSNYYGYRDLENSRVVTEHTLHSIGSVSKLITAIAIIKLEENGLLNLESDINRYLPFSVRHPDYPETAITVRMLMNHSSGIRSNPELIGNRTELSDSWKTGEPYNMDLSLLKEYLIPDGKYYNAELNFTDFEPGTDYFYSNEGTALLALIAEEITGSDFASYCQDHILDPLQMSGSWFYDQVEPEKLALSYDPDLNRINFKKYFNWPSGSFVVSALEFSKFIQLFLNRGTLNGVEILKPETVDKMLTPQNGRYCLQWESPGFTIAGRDVIGKKGDLPGHASFVYMDTVSNEAVILLSNGDWLYPYGALDALAALFLHAERNN